MMIITKELLICFVWHCLLSRIAVFGFVPRKEQSNDENDVGGYFLHKTVIIPHDQKRYRGGEDSASTSDTLLVVADGVGGWARHKVDPGLFSRLLTKTILELDASQSKGKKKQKSLTELVDEANWVAASEHLGSATCTTLKITGKATISTLNIGDSGYSIHRILPNDNGHADKFSDQKISMLFASEPGQKRFNFPHQIGGQYGDKVVDVAQLKVHEFQDGDIIVVYSDGVSDNIFPEEFHSCMLKYLKPEDENKDDSISSFVSHSLVADCIARTAYQRGKDKTYDSPFAKGARDSGKMYIGGKHDDISVIVAEVYSGVKPLDQEIDPHYSESIYIYTGEIPPLDDLPPAVVAKVPVHTEL